MRRRSLKVRPNQDSNSHNIHNERSNNKNISFIEFEGNDLSKDYVNRSEIKKKAIQVFYTESIDRKGDLVSSHKCPLYYKVLHPNGLIRRIFDFVTAIWVLTLVFIIPFLIGFDWYVEPKGQKVFLNLLDIWFAIDIVLNFRTGYIHHGTIIMTPRKIVWNYLTTWFVVDLLGTFPFEKLIKGDSTSRKSLKLIKYFKIPKLLRVSRLMKYVRDHKQVYDLFQVFVLAFTFLHLGACLWMLVLNPCANEEMEIPEMMKVCAQDNIYNLYIESFHLSAAMLLGVSNFHIIGDSTTLDMLTERRKTDQVKMYIVSTLYMIGGLCFVALLISELNVFLFGKKQGSAAFQRKIDRVGYEMEYYGVPDEIQRQVKAFYDYIWIHQKQYDDKVALLSDDQMSTDLQRKLALHLFKDVVSHISLFSEIDDLLLGEICLSLRTRIFLPQDMILFKGDVGKELFIIAKGIVEVLRDDLPPSQRHKASPILLHNGSFFGEIALIMETRRTCSVQARTICETNILEQDTFDTILQRNPDFARRMNELVVARQLERSLTKSEDQEDKDVRVSNVDMANALSAVERNMKQGLERRLQQQGSSLQSVPSESIDVSRERVTFHLNQKHDSPVVIRTSQNAHTIIPKKSEETRPSNMFDHMRSSLRLSNLNSHLNLYSHSQDHSNREVSKIIDDIARRSTRKMNVVDQLPARTRKRINSNGTNDLETGRKQDDSDSSHTQSPEITPRKLIQDKDNYICFEDCEGEDAETMRVTGHFNPNRVTVDINKVHPTILNSGKLDSSPTSFQKKLSKIDERLKAQAEVMKLILSKMDQIGKDEKKIK